MKIEKNQESKSEKKTRNQKTSRLSNENNELQETKIRLAQLESQFMSSWAFHSKRDFEDHVNDKLYNKIQKGVTGFMTKFILTGLAILGGVVFVLMNAIVNNNINEKNEHLIHDLKESNRIYELQLRKSHDWMNHHNSGKNYTYLAEIIHMSNIDDSLKEKSKEECFKNAEKYFNSAIKVDSLRSSPYWELGQLYSENSIKYQVNSFLDFEKARDYYRIALRHYSPYEEKIAWKFIAYYRLIKIIEKEKGKAKYCIELIDDAIASYNNIDNKEPKKFEYKEYLSEIKEIKERLIKNT